MKHKKDMKETVNIRLKIKQIHSGYVRTRDIPKTRSQLAYYKSIINKPMNGYAVVYAEELNEDI